MCQVFWIVDKPHGANFNAFWSDEIVNAISGMYITDNYPIKPWTEIFFGFLW